MSEIVDAVILVRRDFRKQVRQMKRNQRRINRELRKIQGDLNRIYPNEGLLEAVELLTDEDRVWYGDFDTLRQPLANLLMAANRAGMFPTETETITKLLLKHN